MTTINTPLKPCFFIGPFGKDDALVRIHSDQLLEKIVIPAARELGYEVTRGDRLGNADDILAAVISRLKDDEIVIADLSYHNANAFYELAIRDCFDKPVILVSNKGTEPPFNVLGRRVFYFQLDSEASIEDCKNNIISAVRHIQEGTRGYHGPVIGGVWELLVNEARKKYFEYPSRTQDLRNQSSDNWRITTEHIEDEFKKLQIFEPSEWQNEIVQSSSHLLFLLNYNGIFTLGELQALCSSQKIVRILTVFYRDILKRKGDLILDPAALASWGAYLYSNGITEKSIKWVEQGLKASDEYQRGNGSGEAFFLDW